MVGDGNMVTGLVMVTWSLGKAKWVRSNLRKSSIWIWSAKTKEDSELKIRKYGDGCYYYYYWTTVLFVHQPRELCIKCRPPSNSLYGKAFEWVGPPLHHHDFSVDSFDLSFTPLFQCKCSPIVFYPLLPSSSFSSSFCCTLLFLFMAFLHLVLQLSGW